MYLILDGGFYVRIPHHTHTHSNIATHNNIHNTFNIRGLFCGALLHNGEAAGTTSTTSYSVLGCMGARRARRMCVCFVNGSERRVFSTENMIELMQIVRASSTSRRALLRFCCCAAALLLLLSLQCCPGRVFFFETDVTQKKKKIPIIQYLYD